VSVLPAPDLGAPVPLASTPVPIAAPSPAPPTDNEGYVRDRRPSLATQKSKHSIRPGTAGSIQQQQQQPPVSASPVPAPSPVVQPGLAVAPSSVPRVPSASSAHQPPTSAPPATVTFAPTPPPMATRNQPTAPVPAQQPPQSSHMIPGYANGVTKNSLPPSAPTAAPSGVQPVQPFNYVGGVPTSASANQTGYGYPSAQALANADPRYGNVQGHAIGNGQPGAVDQQQRYADGRRPSGSSGKALDLREHKTPVDARGVPITSSSAAAYAQTVARNTAAAQEAARDLRLPYDLAEPMRNRLAAVLDMQPTPPLHNGARPEANMASQPNAQYDPRAALPDPYGRVIPSSAQASPALAEAYAARPPHFTPSPQAPVLDPRMQHAQAPKTFEGPPPMPGANWSTAYQRPVDPADAVARTPSRGAETHREYRLI
jgi:hypothetical protein